MPHLRLQPDHLDTIVLAAFQASPEEACGLLAGVDSDVKLVLPTKNIATQPQSAFAIEPGELLSALRTIDTHRYRLLGTYHSHPHGPLTPSDSDLREVFRRFPNAIHLIVVPSNPEAQLKAWFVDTNGTISDVPIILGNAPHPADAAPLDTAARTLIVLSAILASIILIGVAITLLPPAPILN